jgi:hypothetical protein
MSTGQWCSRDASRRRNPGKSTGDALGPVRVAITYLGTVPKTGLRRPPGRPQRCRQAGVDLVPNAKVDDATTWVDTAVVTSEAGEFRADVALAADGLRSVLRHRATTGTSTGSTAANLVVGTRRERTTRTDRHLGRALAA